MERVVPADVRHGDGLRTLWTVDQLEADGWALQGNVFLRDGRRKLPLYEAKMLHHFDHRYGDYSMRRAGSQDTQLPDVPPETLDDPSYAPMSRYWVDETEVDARLAGRWDRGWLLGWRDISRNDNERTIIAAALPRVATGDTWLLALPAAGSDVNPLFTAVLSTFAADYCARQKVGGSHLKYHTVRQFPIPTPGMLRGDATFAAGPLTDWLVARVLELTYTADDMALFASDLGYDGPPFAWDVQRRITMRAEIDAAMLHLYGIERDDVDYILDTFPIARRNDEQRFGEYRTKRLIMERYDAMAAADATGVAYETPLDPPPGDPRAAHRAPETTAVS